VDLRREDDEVIFTVRCPVQEESGAVPETGTAEPLEKRTEAAVTKILKQESKALLQQGKE